MPAYFYNVLYDVTHDQIAAHEDWYVNRHGPDLVHSAFPSSQFYRAVSGAPGLMTLYDSPSAEPFGGAAYAQMRKEDKNLTNAESFIRNMTKGVFERRVLVGPPAVDPSIDSNVVTALRFQAAETLEPKLADWIATSPSLAGAVRVHLCLLRGLHPLFLDLVPPNWLILIERNALRYEPELKDEVAKEFGSAVANIGVNTCLRLFKCTQKGGASTTA